VLVVVIGVVGVLGAALLTLAIMQRAFAAAPEPPPAPSPVPWLSDEVWRSLGPSDGRLARLGFGGRPIQGPELIPVTPRDQARAPVLPIPKNAPVPPTLDFVSALRALIQTAGPGQIRTPVWPQCCQRLATLVFRQGKGTPLVTLEAQGPLDQAYLEGELSTWGGAAADRARLLATGWREVLAMMRAGSHHGQGIHIYQCRACGRVYVASSGP